MAYFCFVLCAVGSEFRLGILQSLNISSASDYHSFEYDNEVYLVVLSSEVEGPLISSVGSDGAVVSTESEGSFSGLYRWQGIFVPVQVKYYLIVLFFI